MRSIGLIIFAFVIAWGPSAGSVYKKYAILSHIFEHGGELKKDTTISHSHAHHHNAFHNHQHKDNSDAKAVKNAVSLSELQGSKPSSSNDSEPSHSHSIIDFSSNLGISLASYVELNEPNSKEIHFVQRDFFFTSHFLASVFRPPISA